MSTKKSYSISQVIKNFSERDQEIIRLFFGLDGREKKTIKEISDILKISQDYALYYVEEFNVKLSEFEKNKRKSVVKIDRNDYYRVPKIDDNTRKLIDKMSETFFNMFSYNDIEIENCVNSLPKKSRSIIYLFYGLDGVNCLDYDQIAKKYRISVDEVDNIISESISKIKKKLSGVRNVEKSSWKDNKYRDLIDKYGKNKVECAKKILDEISVGIIEDCYLSNKEISLKVIADKYGISYAYAYSKLKKGLNKLDDFLITLDSENPASVFYSKFDGYSKEEVDKILLFFEDRKNIAINYFGLNGERKSLEEISSIYRLEEWKIYSIIEDLCRKIKLRLEKSRNIDNEDFYSLFDGGSKEKINEVLGKLNKEESEIIHLYYGINGEKLRIKEICNKFNKSNYQIHAIVDKIYEEICGLIDNEDNVTVVKKKFNKYDKIVDFYGKEIVDFAYSSLSKKDKDYIKLYYIDGLSVKDIAIRFNTKENTIYQYVSKAMKNLIENINVEEKDKVVLNKEVGLVNNRVINFDNDFYKKFEGYSLESIGEAVSKINERDWIIISKYFGIDHEKKTAVEISKLYGCTVANIYRITNLNIKKINDFLGSDGNGKIENNIPSFAKSRNLYKKFDGYSENIIDEAISKLNERDQNIIKLYYGINEKCLSLQEISEKYSVKNSYMSVIIYNITRKIKYLLENKNDEKKVVKVDKKEKLYKKFEGYSEKEINKAISRLSEKDQEVINLYYGLKGNILSLEELSKKLDIQKNSASGYLYSIYNKITKILQNDGYYKKNKVKKDKKLNVTDISSEEKFYKKFDCEKEKIDKAILKLTEKDRNIITLRYGLNTECLSLQELSNKYCLKKASMAVYVSNILKKIKQLMEEPSIDNSLTKKVKKRKVKDSLKEELYKQFEGHSEKEVNEAIFRLNEKHRNFINIRYGLINETCSISDISKKYNCSEQNVYSVLKTAIKNIGLLLKDSNLDLSIEVGKKKEEKIILSKKEKFYKKFSDYNVDEVNEAMSKLNEKDKELIDQVYGINVKEIPIKEVAKKYNCSIENIYMRNSILIKRISTILLSSKIDSFSFQKKKIRKEEFYQLFNGYNNEEINIAFFKLNDKNKEIISLYYGLNEEEKTQKQISEKYNCTPAYISAILKRSISKIKYYLENPNITINNKQVKKIIKNKKLSVYEKEFYNKFKGYSKSKIYDAYEKLNNGNKKILASYYGLNTEKLSLEEIKENFDTDIESIEKIVAYSVLRIQQMLDEKTITKVERKTISRDVKFQEFKNKYGDNVVLRAMSNLTDSEKAFLIMYYNIGGVKKYTLSEISEKIGVDKSKFSILEEGVLAKLEKHLKPTLIKIKNEEFISLIKDKKNFVKAKEILTKSEFNLIVAYYGLNGTDIVTINELCDRIGSNRENVEKIIKNIIYKINNYNSLKGRK